MDHVLTQTRQIHEPPRDYLDAVGEVFQVFGPDTQDSGNLSYGVESDGVRFFVKTTDPQATAFLDYNARVGLLRNAVRIARSCHHPVLPRLWNVIESPHGPVLVYQWVPGELLRNQSARERLHVHPIDQILTILDRVYELHAELADQGRVAMDFYDGCLIYDFAADRLHVVDLDGYHDGPFRNTMGRMFGSSRFMAPEEFEHGALIDQRTTVFTMGRTAAVLLADGLLDRSAFRAGDALHEVMIRACQPLPTQRVPSMRQFQAAWQQARRAEPDCTRHG